jgi:hypothetical protein
MLAFGLLHNLFENILHGQTGSQERDPVAVHQVKQVPPRAIDTSHVLKVDRDGAVWLRGQSATPAVLEFGDKGACQSTLHSQYYGFSSFLDFNLHHRLGTAYRKRKFWPKSQAIELTEDRRDDGPAWLPGCRQVPN